MLLTAYLKRQQALINRSLATYLPAAREVPGSIHQAMRYSVLGEGKRIRPILALAAAEAVGMRGILYRVDRGDNLGALLAERGVKPQP